MPVRLPSRRGPAVTRALTLTLPLALVACAAPESARLSASSARDAVLAREPSVALAVEALELADLDRLALAPPDAVHVVDPARDDFWRAAAWAWSPAVRAARARVLATAARRGSAGAPGPADLRVVDHEFGGDDALVEAVATFDLIGLLGVGPSAAARELASTEELLARAALEAELWSAPFRVERARVRVTAARAREAALTALHDDAARDFDRLAVLERRGRISAARFAVADARLHAVEHRASRERDRLTAARLELARSSGLPPEHPALAGHDRDWLAARSAAAGERPRDAGVSDGHPRLRAARLAVAREEARLRAVARSAWPGLRLGPHLSFPDSGTNVGGAVALTLPFPSQWEGELAAAEVERDRAIEAHGEVLHEQLARADEAWTRLAEGLERRAEHAAPLDAATAAGWRAVRARFRVNESDAEEWGRALADRAQALVVLIDEDEAIALARLDLAEAAGPDVRAEEATP